MPTAVWRGQLVFGLVSIPVRLHKAARRKSVRFHDVYSPTEAETGAKCASETPVVANVPERRSKIQPLPNLPPAEDEPSPPEQVERVRHVRVGESPEVHLSSQEILKGYEVAPDQYVVLKPSEISALRPRTSTELEITEFVKLKEVDLIFLDTSYYVSPDRGGEKPYALLYRVLAESGDAAVGAFAMHGREHAAIIRPGTRGLILHTLFHSDEVEQGEEANADTRLISEKELQLARMLVSTMAAPFDPSKLKDSFRERLLEMIESRSRSPVVATRPEKQEPAPVVDIMEALRKSLQAIRKPAVREVSGGRIHKKEKHRAK